MKLFFQYMVTQYTFNTNQILVYHPISRLIHSELIIQNCYINLAFRFCHRYLLYDKHCNLQIPNLLLSKYMVTLASNIFITGTDYRILSKVNE